MAVFSLQEVKKLQVQNVTDNNFESWPEGATYGYIAGGGSNVPSYFSIIIRLDFSNDSFSTPGNNLPTGITQLAAVTN
jgi:hypothetical protein